MPAKKQTFTAVSSARISVNIHDVVSLSLVTIPNAVNALIGRTGGMDDEEAVGVFREISFILLRCEESVAERNPLPIIALLGLLNEAFGKSYQTEAIGKMAFEEDTALLLSLERIFTAIFVQNQLEDPPFIDSVTAAAQERHFALLGATPQAVAVAELLHVLSVITTIPSIRKNSGNFLVNPIKDALMVHLYSNFITTVSPQSTFTAISTWTEGDLPTSGMNSRQKDYNERKSGSHFNLELITSSHKQGPKVNLDLLEVDLPEGFNNKDQYPQLTINSTRFIMTIFINLIRASEDNHLRLKWLFLPNAIGMSCDFFFQLQCLELMYRLNRKSNAYQKTWRLPSNSEGWLGHNGTTIWTRMDRTISTEEVKSADISDDIVLPTSSSSKNGGNIKKQKSIAVSSPKNKQSTLTTSATSEIKECVCAFETVGRAVVEHIHTLKPTPSLLLDMVQILEQCHTYGLEGSIQGKTLRPILSFVTKRVEVAGEELDQGNTGPWKVYFCPDHFIIMMGNATVDQICIPYSFLRSATVTKSNSVSFRLYMAPTRVKGMMNIESAEEDKDRISIEFSSSNIYKFRKSAVQRWIMNAMTRRKEAASSAKKSREVTEFADQNCTEEEKGTKPVKSLSESNTGGTFDLRSEKLDVLPGVNGSSCDKHIYDNGDKELQQPSCSKTLLTVDHQTPFVSDASSNTMSLPTYVPNTPPFESAVVRLNFDNTSELSIEKSHTGVVKGVENKTDENQRLIDRILELENCLAAVEAAAKSPRAQQQKDIASQKSSLGLKRSRSHTDEESTIRSSICASNVKPLSEDVAHQPVNTVSLATTLRALVTSSDQNKGYCHGDTSIPKQGSLRTQLLINETLDDDGSPVFRRYTQLKGESSTHDGTFGILSRTPISRSTTKEESLIGKDNCEYDTCGILLEKENDLTAISNSHQSYDGVLNNPDKDICDSDSPSLSKMENNAKISEQENLLKHNSTLRAAIALKTLIDEKLSRKRTAVQQRLQRSMSVLQHMVDSSRIQVYKNIMVFETDVTEGIEAAAGAEAAVRKSIVKSLFTLNERVDAIERWSNEELRNAITCTEINALQALEDGAESERLHLKTIKAMVDVSMRNLEEYENKRAMVQDPLEELKQFLSQKMYR